MTTTNLPNIGDVIISPKFAFGYYDDEDKRFFKIDGVTREHRIESYRSEDERVAEAARTGAVPPKSRFIELGAYDGSRATARFVVETANLQGGGTGMGPHDVYPNGWHVQARRLNSDGSYDPRGEVIHFYMTGAFNYKVDPEDVSVVSKMVQRFV